MVTVSSKFMAISDSLGALVSSRFSGALLDENSAGAGGSGFSAISELRLFLRAKAVRPSALALGGRVAVSVGSAGASCSP